jgi:hypothetical protein
MREGGPRRGQHAYHRPQARRPHPDRPPPPDAQEIEAEGHFVTALMCGEELRIIPPGAWRMSWQRLLNAGQIDAFAELVMHPEDFDLFQELDPTVQEWTDFISDASRQGGESQGNSRGPAPSPRNTRRR